MRYKLILILCCLTLVGCGKTETIDEPVSSVVLEAPITEIKESVVEEVTQEYEEETPTFEVSNRTNIMVSDDNKDTFNKQEEQVEESTEEVVEEDPLLSRFKQNQDNIKLPANYKISGSVKVTDDKTVQLSISRTKDKQCYLMYSYDDVLMEQFIVDDTVPDNIKEVYTYLSHDDLTIDGRIENYDMQPTTYSDFKVLGVEAVSRNGNNYKLTSSFVINGEQFNGTIVVGDNMNVYNINYTMYGLEYDVRVQTLLKLPKTKADYNASNITPEEVATYTEYIDNVFSVDLPQVHDNEYVVDGWVSYDKKVETKLDESGNILYVTVIETYTYEDGDVTILKTRKDLEGNVLGTEIEYKGSTQVGETEETDSDESVIFTQRPTFALDENLSAKQLEDALSDWIDDTEGSKVFTYTIVDIGDPTKIAVDFTATKPVSSETELKQIIEIFASNNYTTVVEWR
jgi:hypothetical protein